VTTPPAFRVEVLDDAVRTDTMRGSIMILHEWWERLTLEQRRVVIDVASEVSGRHGGGLHMTSSAVARFRNDFIATLIKAVMS